MILYCWEHNTVHHFQPRDIERIVYALAGAHSDAVTDEAPVFAGEASDGHIPCPDDVLRWSFDGEMYAEHVEQGIESRRVFA